MTKHAWTEIGDYEFTQLFVGKTITEVLASMPNEVAPYVDADLFWHLNDGGWIAMHLADQSIGCETCGHGRDEKTYYFLAP